MCWTTVITCPGEYADICWSHVKNTCFRLHIRNSLYDLSAFPKHWSTKQTTKQHILTSPHHIAQHHQSPFWDSAFQMVWLKSYVIVITIIIIISSSSIIIIITIIIRGWNSQAHRESIASCTPPSGCAARRRSRLVIILLLLLLMIIIIIITVIIVWIIIHRR